jgi:glycosyltransferase involved in cell wall biosynthesis
MKLSIITINKDNSAGLEKTIQTVVEQTFDDFEYIVIDGASSDGSVEIIKKHADKITFWVSEPDAGIYNAMNKGIKKAQGDYCLFLNSGDFLVNSNTLKNVFEEIKNYPESDVYYSDYIKQYSKQNNTIGFVPKVLNIEYLLLHTLNHQNTLIKKELFLIHGLYNENLKIVSDWEFLLSEFWIHKSRFTYIKTHIAIYDKNGISMIQEKKTPIERRTILNNMFKELSPVILDYVNYKSNLSDIICLNIQQRQGLGLRFILRCIKNWFFRIKNTKPSIVTLLVH